MKVPAAVALITHSYPESVGEGVAKVVAAVKDAGAELIVTASEIDKHGEALTGATTVDALPADAGLCLVLGGDGSILYSMRKLAGTGVPVFGVNFGTVGFLTAVDRDEIDSGLRSALAGEVEVLSMPGLTVGIGSESHVALNDFSFARRPQGKVAELSYRVGSDEVADVRCDGLVAATPAGSTGYNLANGGPILAWGVEGYAVSFISPHTLTARSLVIAPEDVLTVRNVGSRDSVDVVGDGVMIGELEPEGEIEVAFQGGVGTLAQLHGATFYQRVREKFGLLARPQPDHG